MTETTEQSINSLEGSSESHSRGPSGLQASLDSVTPIGPDAPLSWLPDKPEGEKIDRFSAQSKLIIAEHLDMLPQGHTCVNCLIHCAVPYGDPSNECVLQIDHIDGIRANRSLRNLRWLCDYRANSCNLKLRKRLNARAGSAERERRENGPGGDGRRETRNISWESARSLELGPTFDLELRRLLEESAADESRKPGSGWLPIVKNVENRLAKICGCGQLCVSRWLEREANTPEGKFTLTERTISDGRKKRTAQIVELKDKPAPDYNIGSLEVSSARAARTIARVTAEFLEDLSWECRKGHVSGKGLHSRPARCELCGSVELREHWAITKPSIEGSS